MSTPGARMRILGVDPGLASTGVGVIEVDPDGAMRALGWRKVTTAASVPMPERLRRIHALVADIIREFEPTVMAVEDIFFAKNVRSAVAMAHGRGAAILAGAALELDVREFAPREIKLAVTGRGSAGKDQVKAFVGIWLGLKRLPRSDHESDALAIALCAALRERGRTLARVVPAKDKAPPRGAPDERITPGSSKDLLAQSLSRKRSRRGRR